MWMAIISKELRECGLYAGLALLVMAHYVGSLMDFPLIPLLSSGRGQLIPFILNSNSNHESTFTIIAIAAAIVLGLHQSIWESWRQTSLFLLHRPMPLVQIFLVKMSAGIGILLFISAIPLLVYCLWAATPGTHASPFYWGMTEPWWRSVAVAVISYLGAFLSGLRPAHWLGSRTWPALAAICIALGLKLIPIWESIVYIGFASMTVCLVFLILKTAQIREFP